MDGNRIWANATIAMSALIRTAVDPIIHMWTQNSVTRNKSAALVGNPFLALSISSGGIGWFLRPGQRCPAFSSAGGIGWVTKGTWSVLIGERSSVHPARGTT